MGDFDGHPFRGNQYKLVKTGGGEAGTFSSRTPARVTNEYDIRDQAGKVAGFMWSHDDPEFKGHVKAWSVKKHGELRKFPYFKAAKEWALGPDQPGGVTVSRGDYRAGGK